MFLRVFVFLHLACRSIYFLFCKAVERVASLVLKKHEAKRTRV